METCATIEALLVTDPASPVVEAHIASCEACRGAREMALVLARVARPAEAKEDVALAFQPGQTVLHYTLVELLGSGGQGAVFKAVERDLPEAFVAVKIVPASAVSIKEARAKAITHANVMRIHHTTLVGAHRVIEMEHVEGGTLADRLSRVAKEPLPFKEAIAIYRGVLAGVEALHKANLLHLDLKPRNILLRGGVVPVVTDFGMSVRPGSRVLGGTNGWTAPEVLDGLEPDVRADIYSLGKILDAMIDRPARALAAVIQRAESTRPDRRYPDVAGLRAALDEALALDSASLAFARTVPISPEVAADRPDAKALAPSDALPTRPLAARAPEPIAASSETESITLPLATVRALSPRAGAGPRRARAPWVLALAVASLIAILAGTRALSTTKPAAMRELSARDIDTRPPASAVPTVSAEPPPPPASAAPAAPSSSSPKPPEPARSAPPPRSSASSPSIRFNGVL